MKRKKRVEIKKSETEEKKSVDKAKKTDEVEATAKQPGRQHMRKHTVDEVTHT